MKKFLLVGWFCCWIAGYSSAQSDTHVTISATVTEVYSHAYDDDNSLIRVRHRLRVQAALNNDAFKNFSHNFDRNDNDRDRWWGWNREVLGEDSSKAVPEKIRFKFWGYEDEARGGNDQNFSGEFEFPIDFAEGKSHQVTLRIGEDSHAGGFYRARVNIKYTIPRPQPGEEFIVSDSPDGDPVSNFCEGSPIHLSTQRFKEINTGLQENEFKYVWEYHLLNDDITETTSTPARISTNSTCYDPKALVDIRVNGATTDPSRNYGLCGDYVYDTECYECQSTTRTIDERWFQISESDEPFTLWTAARRNGYKKVAFRYRLKHITNGQAGPPSDTTGYVTIYDPPPTLNYTDNPEPNFSTAANSVYDNGDLRVTHVACHADTTGQVTIKNVTGSPGREYFYTLKGPVPKDSPSPTEADGGALWNIDGQGKPTPQSNQSATWLTFPQDDPTGLQQLKAGTYWLIIENWDRRDPTTDNKLENLNLRACYVARKITVKQPEVALTAKDSPKAYVGDVHVSCYESSDGEVTIDAGGGIAPYRYLLRKQGDAAFIEQSTPTFTDLASHRAGTPINYDYYVKDAMGCPTKVKQFSLTAPAPLQVKTAAPTHAYPSGGPYNIRCHGGTDQATLAAQGGTAPYTIRINGTDYSTDQDGNPVVVEGLSGDIDYAIRMTDANGCQVNTTLRLQQPDSLLLTQHEVVPPTCAGGDNGRIFLEAKRGIPLTGGKYTYTIRHTNVPPEYQAIFSAEQILTDTTAEFVNLIAGTYSVTILDQYDCAYDTTLTLTPPPPLQIRGDTRPITCRGDEDGALWTAVSGGTPPYRLDIGQIGRRDTLRTVVNHPPDRYDSLFSLPSEKYWVHVTDANGCAVQAQWNVASPRQALSLTVDTLRHVSPISCFGANDGRVLLTATGGWTNRPYRYGRSPDALREGQQSFERLGPGTHTFYVQDGRGCTDSVRVTLREPAPLTAEVATVQHVRCHGDAAGSIALQVAGGTLPYRISLDRGASWQYTTRPEGLRAGTYELWVADENGCQASPLLVTLTEPPLLDSRIVSTQDTRCGVAEGAALVSVTGGVAPYQVAWFDEVGTSIGTGFSVDQLYSGRYTARITDANRCVDSLTVTISDRNGPVVRLVETQSVRCAGGTDGSATVEISGGTEPLRIRWEDGQEQRQAVGLSGGEHRVEVTDANGCRVFLTVSVGEPFPLEIITEQQDNPVCSGEINGRLAVIAQGGNGAYQYAWNTGSTARTLDALAAGAYVVTVTDGQGCQTQDTLHLQDPHTIAPPLPDTLMLCYGQRATLDAGYPGHTYAWTSTIGQTGQDQRWLVQNPGTYQVTVTNEQGCRGTKSTEVIYSNELLNAEFLMTSEAQTGDTVVLVDISWPTPESTDWHYPNAEPLAGYEVYQELIYDQPGNYEVTLRAWVGECEDEITKSITITEAAVVPENGRTAAPDIIRSFQLLPNPNDGRFVARIELREVAPVRLYLTDLNSKGVLSDIQKDEQANYDVSYDLAHLSAGVYLLTLHVKDELRTQRVLIR